eukprot:1841114-Amphidinium_carterae.1
MKPLNDKKPSKPLKHNQNWKESVHSDIHKALEDANPLGQCFSHSKSITRPTDNRHHQTTCTTTISSIALCKETSLRACPCSSRFTDNSPTTCSPHNSNVHFMDDMSTVCWIQGLHLRGPGYGPFSSFTIHSQTLHIPPCPIFEVVMIWRLLPPAALYQQASYGYFHDKIHFHLLQHMFQQYSQPIHLGDGMKIPAPLLPLEPPPSQMTTFSFIHFQQHAVQHYLQHNHLFTYHFPLRAPQFHMAHLIVQHYLQHTL